jgi:hypothetical protein
MPIPKEYAAKIGQSAEIDRHRSRSQSSAMDFQIAYYFQMVTLDYLKVNLT